MAQKQTSMPVDLPEALRRQFLGLAGRLLAVETAVALGVGLAGLAASFLVLFFSDRLGDTPRGLRVGITLAGMTAAAAAAVWWGGRRMRRRRDWRALSHRVQRRFRPLGDRLLGIVELADASERPPEFSPELYHAAIRQVAADAAEFDFRQTVNLKPARRVSVVSLVLLGTAGLVLALLPAAGRNAWRRWARPWAAIDRYTLVALAGLPRQVIVPRGESFEIACAVRYRSFWRPTRAACWLAGEPAIGGMVRQREVRFRVPAQTQPGELHLRVGDAERVMSIVPTDRPGLQGLTATVELPAYLGYAPVEEQVADGTLAVLEGSRVRFRGKTSRALASATVAVGSGSPVALAVSGSEFVSQAEDLDAVSQGVFTWRDTLGLSNVAPWRLTVRHLQDQPPEPDLPDLPRESAVLESDVVEVKVVARDDFGVRDLGLMWERAADWQRTNSAAPRRFWLPAESHTQRELSQSLRLSPALLGVPADSTLEVQGFARDFRPGRAPATTPVHRIYVLGLASHAELVRQNLEAAMSHLEEVTRREEKITNDTRALRERKQPPSDATVPRAPEVAEDQLQNATQLNRLADEGVKLLREALKNPTFTAQTLTEWARKFESMRTLADGLMQQAARSLQSAAQSTSSRAGQLAAAAGAEEKILETLAQLQARINQGLDQLQALTLAQRLRKVASAEQTIAGHLRGIVPETIGLLPRELPAPYQRTQTGLADAQDTQQKESQTLQGEISRFFERTQRQNYGQVSRQMADARAAEELDRIRGLIQDNVSMDAMENLAAWARRFDAWADQLEPKSAAGGGGGGGAGGSAASQVLNELLGLLRLRAAEINLRVQTGIVDQQKADASAYRSAAARLAKTHEKLGRDLDTIQARNPLRILEQPLRQTRTAMGRVQALLDKPETDPPTDQAEGRAIDLLSDAINLINESIQRGGNSASREAQELAFLFQMLAPTSTPGTRMAPLGGGNRAGGTTDRRPPAAAGDVRGNLPEARDVRKASGMTGRLPAEFRDALENYYHGLEQDGR